MKKNFLLFDFDGVIANTFAQAFGVNKMICPHITEDDYRKYYEGNINDWRKVEKIHTDKCRNDIVFFDEYLPKMKKHATIFPDMKDVVSNLAKSYNLIIISSTTTAPICEFLEKHGIREHFHGVMGNDVHKSKVEKIKMVLSKHKICSKDCVFITDTLGDIKEAGHHNMDAICVSWGYHGKETLARGNPFRIVHEPKHLLTAVSDYFNK